MTEGVGPGQSVEIKVRHEGGTLWLWKLADDPSQAFLMKRPQEFGDGDWDRAIQGPVPVIRRDSDGGPLPYPVDSLEAIVVVVFTREDHEALDGISHDDWEANGNRVDNTRPLSDELQKRLDKLGYEIG